MAVRTLKALVRLRGCSDQMSLAAHVINRFSHDMPHQQNTTVSTSATIVNPLYFRLSCSDLWSSLFQNHAGRALYWGSQGLKRNLEAAIEYFRMGAETEDPQSMYDYGVVLLRVMYSQLL